MLPQRFGAIIYAIINEGLFDVFTCQNKDPAFHFRRDYTLSHPHHKHLFICCRHDSSLIVKPIFFSEN